MPKLIAPKPYVIQAISQAIDSGLLTAGAIAKAEFFAFTATWSSSNQPTWTEEGPKTERGARVWRYTTSSQPLVWIDDGTPSHPIAASAADRLRFQNQFTPKTRPGQVFSGFGGKFGDWVSPTAVTHPGTAPRNISKAIGDTNLGDKVGNLIDAAMRTKV